MVLEPAACSSRSDQFIEAALACEEALNELPKFHIGDLATLKSGLEGAEFGFQSFRAMDGLVLSLPNRDPSRLLQAFRGGGGSALLSTSLSAADDGARADDWQLSMIEFAQPLPEEVWSGPAAYGEVLDWLQSNPDCKVGSTADVVMNTLRAANLSFVTSQANADAFHVYRLPGGLIALEAGRATADSKAAQADWLFYMEDARQPSRALVIKLTHYPLETGARGLPLAAMLGVGTGSTPAWTVALESLMRDGSNLKLSEYGRQNGWRVDLR